MRNREIRNGFMHMKREGWAGSRHPEKEKKSRPPKGKCRARCVLSLAPDPFYRPTQRHRKETSKALHYLTQLYSSSACPRENEKNVATKRWTLNIDYALTHCKIQRRDFPQCVPTFGAKQKRDAMLATESKLSCHQA